MTAQHDKKCSIYDTNNSLNVIVVLSSVISIGYYQTFLIFFLLPIVCNDKSDIMSIQ